MLLSRSRPGADRALPGLRRPWLALGLCLALAAVVPSARAEDEPDPLAGLRPGMRIEIRLKSQEIFRGEVKWVLGDRLKIDLTYENRNIEGALTFSRAQIRSVQVIQALSEREKERILQDREESRARALADAEAARRERDAARQPAPDEEAPAAPGGGAEAGARAGGGSATREEREKSDRAALLARFPVAAGWNEKRYGELVGKHPRDLEPEEKEFLDRYTDWSLARKEGKREERKALFARFPPGKGWGPEKYDALVMQDIRFKKHDGAEGITTDPITGRKRARYNDRIPPLSTEEREFVDHFDDWKLALSEAREDAADKAAETERGRRDAGADAGDGATGSGTGAAAGAEGETAPPAGGSQ